MVRMGRWVFLGLALSLLALCVPLLAGEPCTITVRPGASIQAAIDAASEGAVICLGEGEWVESLTITKSLTLMGAGTDRTILRANPMDRGVVLIGRPDVYVAPPEWVATAPALQVVLQGVSIFGTEVCGVMVNSRASATLTDCAVTQGELAAVAAWESAALVMRRCTISLGIVGVEVGYDAAAELSHCTIRANHTGVRAFLSGRIEVLQSSITENMFGAELSGSSSVMLTDSEVSGNMMWGVFVQEEAQAVLERMAVIENGPMLGGGIMATMASGIVVSDSTLSGNGTGVRLFGAAQARLYRNQIVANRSLGISLAGAPCVPTGEAFQRYLGLPTGDEFQGYVAGSANVILGLGITGEPDAFCPDSLSFLVTPEGGELDRRK